MTSMEQIEYIAVEARKMGISFDEWRVKYGHTLPKPESTEPSEKEQVSYRVVCEECGGVFTAFKAGVRFCPACRNQRNLAAARRRRMRKLCHE